MRTGEGAFQERRIAILFLLPAALLVTAALVLPVLRIATLSFAVVSIDGELKTAPTLANHAALLADARWWASLRNTAVFTTASVAIELLLGLGFALLLDRPFRGRGTLRALVVLPWALPTAVMALAWAWIFNDAFGVANDLLTRLGLIDECVAWLASPGTAMAAIVVADVWKTTPFVTLVLLAGLQTIPGEVLEAARLDGLSPVQRLTRVVLPLLAPFLLVAATFRALQAFGAFDIAYVMTGGGPGGATETVSLLAYRSFFRFLDFGYGAAVAVQSAITLGLLAVVLHLVSRAAASRAGEAR